MIKKLFAFLFILSFAVKTSHAQDEDKTSTTPFVKPSTWCGTTLSKEQLDWLDFYQRNEVLFQTKSASGPVAYIPVKAHIVGDDNGGGYFPITSLFAAICELNQRYGDSLNFHFFLYEDVDYINSTSFYSDGSQSNSVAQTLMHNHKRGGALNIYFVQASPGLCGYYTPSIDAVVIIGACGVPGGTTIAHEVGHYFSLPHTFYGWEGTRDDCNVLGKIPFPPKNTWEKMDRTNCHTTADKFCDTPVDYLPFRWNAPYHCDDTDQNGIKTHPDSSLYMSYADDASCTRFSYEQYGAMKANVATVRQGYTLNSAQNMTSVTGLTTLLTPAAGASAPADWVTFTWRKVAGAEKYCVAIYKTSGSNTQVYSKITTDTTASFDASAKLKGNTQYFWKVNAFNVGKPCNNFSAARSLLTTAPTGIEGIGNLNYFEIAPNPASNYFKINYTVENATGVKLIVTDLAGRQIYASAITTTDGEETISTENWAAGLYLVQLKSSNGILKTDKLIVTK